MKKILLLVSLLLATNAWAVVWSFEKRFDDSAHHSWWLEDSNNVRNLYCAHYKNSIPELYLKINFDLSKMYTNDGKVYVPSGARNGSLWRSFALDVSDFSLRWGFQFSLDRTSLKLNVLGQRFYDCEVVTPTEAHEGTERLFRNGLGKALENRKKKLEKKKVLNLNQTTTIF